MFGKGCINSTRLQRTGPSLRLQPRHWKHFFKLVVEPHTMITPTQVWLVIWLSIRRWNTNTTTPSTNRSIWSQVILQVMPIKNDLKSSHAKNGRIQKNPRPLGSSITPNCNPNPAAIVSHCQHNPAQIIWQSTRYLDMGAYAVPGRMFPCQDILVLMHLVAFYQLHIHDTFSVAINYSILPVSFNSGRALQPIHHCVWHIPVNQTTK